jgi:hypothetical protein
VPVGDILSIEFAPRQGGESDGRQVQFPDYTRTRRFANTARVVKRTTLEEASGSLGARREFRLRGRHGSYVCGSNPYTLISCVATAADHAGVLRDGEAGVVRVESVPSPPAYPGTTRHGITSDTWDEAIEEEAFRILGPGAEQAP